MSRKKRGKKHPRQRDRVHQKARPEPRPAHAKPSPATTCRECQAENDPGASECWLCGRRDWRGDPTSSTTRTLAEEPSVAQWLPSVETVLIVLALAVVGAGVVRLTPGLGIVFFILLVPAWVVTERRARERETPMSAPRKFVEVLGWTIAIPFLAAMSLPILLICICAAAIGVMP